MLLQWVLVLLQQYAEDNRWVKESTAKALMVCHNENFSALLSVASSFTILQYSQAYAPVALAGIVKHPKCTLSLGTKEV